MAENDVEVSQSESDNGFEKLEAPSLGAYYGNPVVSRSGHRDYDEEDLYAPSLKSPSELVESVASHEKKQATKGCCGCAFANLDPRVLDLIFWRDPKTTGAVFSSMLFLLLSLALFSAVSVFAYFMLAALTVTVGFVAYKRISNAVQKVDEGHPFKTYLDLELAIPRDRVHHLAETLVGHLTVVARELRSIFLVEDIIVTLKFAVILYILTYVGSWFNGMTLCIMALIDIFTIPKFYDTFKVQIDQYLDIIKGHVKNIREKIRSKMPATAQAKKEKAQ